MLGRKVPIRDSWGVRVNFLPNHPLYPSTLDDTDDTAIFIWKMELYSRKITPERHGGQLRGMWNDRAWGRMGVTVDRIGVFMIDCRSSAGATCAGLESTAWRKKMRE